MPVPVLRPALTICKPTGVTLAPGSRVVMMPDKGGVAEALTQAPASSRGRGPAHRGAAGCGRTDRSGKSWMAAGPVQGVYWLPALDHEGSLRDMDLAGWSEALRVRVKAALSHHARSLRADCGAGNVPGFGDAAGRAARIRRGWSGSAAGRCGRWHHQDLQARAGRRSGQGRRFRAGKRSASQVAEMLIEETLLRSWRGRDRL